MTMIIQEMMDLQTVRKVIFRAEANEFTADSKVFVQLDGEDSKWVPITGIAIQKAMRY
jgi:hypothetical protein